jgi:hypothetical protein
MYVKILLVTSAILAASGLVKADEFTNDLLAGSHYASECAGIYTIMTSVPLEVDAQLNKSAAKWGQMFGSISGLFMKHADGRVVTNGEVLRRASAEIVEIGKQFDRDAEAVSRKVYACDVWLRTAGKVFSDDTFIDEIEALKAIGLPTPLPKLSKSPINIDGLKAAFSFWNDAGRPTPDSKRNELIRIVEARQKKMKQP